MLCVQQQEEWRCAAMPEAEGGDGGDKAEHPTEGGYSVTVQRLCVLERCRGSGRGQQRGDGAADGLGSQRVLRRMRGLELESRASQ